MASAKLNCFLIIVILFVLSFNIYMKFCSNEKEEEIPNESTSTTSTTQTTTYYPTKIIATCIFNWDCEWKSTNCCTENAGAYWQCINKESYIDCLSKQILCPQVISPKPSASCVCENWSCIAK
jgi:hypothetical protein